MMMTYRGVDYVYHVVIQVSPTPKVSVGRPTNLHDLLAQLGLSHYEPKFVEQDVDLEVCAYLISSSIRVVINIMSHVYGFFQKLISLWL